MLRKAFAFTLVCALSLACAFSEDNSRGTISFTTADGKSVTVNIPSSVPESLYNILKRNESTITQKLREHNVTESTIKSALSSHLGNGSEDTDNGDIGSMLNQALSKVMGQANGGSEGSGTNYANQVEKIATGIDGLGTALVQSIPNSQSVENVYAEAWIGMLKNAHFGLGLNAGAATLDVSSLVDIVDALSGALGGSEEGGESGGALAGLGELTGTLGAFGNKLVFPTVTADIRLGGIALPFDIGFTAMWIDTTRDPYTTLLSKTGADAMLSEHDMKINYKNFGGDIRYAIVGGTKPSSRFRWSVGAGFYYLEGGFEAHNFGGSGGEAAQVSEDGGSGSGGALINKIDASFKSYTAMLSTQVSYKVLCFVPFAGFRALVSKTTVDVNVDANWASLFGGTGGTEATAATVTTDSSSTPNIGELISDFVDWNIIPSEWSGFSFHPQVYAGLGIDAGVLSLTVSAGYDFVSRIPSAAASFRIKW